MLGASWHHGLRCVARAKQRKKEREAEILAWNLLWHDDKKGDEKFRIGDDVLWLDNVAQAADEQASTVNGQARVVRGCGFLLNGR